MIKGLGIDLVENSRIKKLLAEKRESFLKKVFLDEEIKYCKSKKNSIECFSARIACKEAVFKAFGTGWGKYSGWKDIQIIKTMNGVPEIIFHGKAKKYWQDSGFKQIKITLSHTENYSIAVAILE